VKSAALRVGESTFVITFNVEGDCACTIVIDDNIVNTSAVNERLTAKNIDAALSRMRLFFTRLFIGYKLKLLIINLPSKNLMCSSN
jgi:hypothetical protein